MEWYQEKKKYFQNRKNHNLVNLLFRKILESLGEVEWNGIGGRGRDKIGRNNKPI